MIYGSVCSGIAAESVAWGPGGLGWRCAFHAETAEFPRAVLRHYWPEVPLYGDFAAAEFREKLAQKARSHRYGAIDVMVAGTPCQSFSIAGHRGGLADGRGDLALEFFALAGRLRPRWLVWENVPGVLSSDDRRDFSIIIGALEKFGYQFAWRSLDARYFGLAQRRRRVFIVGYLGNWTCAAAVLFDSESVRGDPAPRGEPGAGTAGTLTAGFGRRRGCGLAEAAAAGHLMGYGGNETRGPLDVATAVRAKGGTGHGDFESETFIAGTLPADYGKQCGNAFAQMENSTIAHPLRAEGFDASEDGTGRGTPLVLNPTQVTSPGNYSEPKPGDPCHPLAARAHPPVVAFGHLDDGRDAGEVAPTLRAMGSQKNHEGRGGNVAISVCMAPDPISAEDVAMPITGRHGDPGTVAFHGVRRLTPRECERLQGFPDDYTLIEWRGKPAADGPRYRALGNAMAVPVIRWIGKRIEMVEAVINGRQ